MALLRLFVLGASVLPSTLALPANDPVNLHAAEAVDKRQYSRPEDRAQAVVEAFKFSWDGYYRYAFPNDELKPVTNGFDNSRYTFRHPQNHPKPLLIIQTETDGAPPPSTPSLPPS
jgi:mannosyl-oligosaccharide alpha-1,2-mannosidase